MRIEPHGAASGAEKPLSAFAPGTELEVVEVLNRGGWANGDVYTVRDATGSGLLIVKTYAEKNPMIRRLGSFLLGRERRAYRLLADLPGIPQMIESSRPDVLLLEHIEGERLREPVFERAGRLVVDRLQTLLDQMHARGLCHMDLRNQGNILVTNDNRVYLLDFASSVRCDGRWFLTRWLGKLYLKFDHYGLAKWQQRVDRTDTDQSS